ncbi:MAG: hypothetical protein NTX33_04790 [Propionibacteriales bacterium]|nr:hypothetical protein [Propionibacteriales bacterium]
MNIKNNSGQDLYVPTLARVVFADQIIEVSDEQAEGLTCQSIWGSEDDDPDGD